MRLHSVTSSLNTETHQSSIPYLLYSPHSCVQLKKKEKKKVLTTINSKVNTKNIIGVNGLQQLLQHLGQSKSTVKTVCIGGINASNVSRVIWQSTARDKSVDGVAVVSAVMASKDPEAAAQELRRLLRTPPAFGINTVTTEQQDRSPQQLIDLAVEVICTVSQKRPLSHNMTNLVVQNFAANVALCVGASPIMANYGEEARDLAKLGGALVVNMGTVTPEGVENYLKALEAYNSVGGPVVFDPVGAGATEVRKSVTKRILGSCYIDVLKGNRAEILSLLPEVAQVQQRGVESSGDDSGTISEELASGIKNLAIRLRNIVVMTGKIDYITAGGQIFAIKNGHEYLGMVTGTGCCLGTVISAMIAAFTHDKLAATVAGVLLYNIAAQKAAVREDVKGPGSFVPAFLDELYNSRLAALAGHHGWLKDMARVEVLGA
ncbi:Hydroxyethylthiazole kinase family-domain-containing protein [Xylaria sp. CBS 124048]|nr:Hydroxyethylthiazole kinase family-domain-containing protein [Xylaria sp. CBS 124048]